MLFTDRTRSGWKAVILMMPTDDVVRDRLTLMDQATVVLNTHISTADGVCGGCMQIWGRWVPASGCTNLLWARSIMETHGVDDNAWDVPARLRSGAPIAA
jgi:hypothetical protein